MSNAEPQQAAMNSNKSPRLIELSEVPRPVFSSVYLALSTEMHHAYLSYHRHVESADKLDFSNIRVLNFTEPTSCATLHFGCAVASSIEEWDGDSSGGHELTKLGLRSGRIYELANSEWVERLQNVRRPDWSDRLGGELRHFVCAFRINVVQVAATSLQYFESESALRVASTSYMRPTAVAPREV